MSEPRPAAPDGDEVDQVLASLSAWIGRVSSPVIRLCLEEAHADIAHLASRDEPASDVQSAAA